MSILGAFALGLLVGGGLFLYLMAEYVREYTEEFVEIL